MTMGRQAYPSDLTNEQWILLEPNVSEPSMQGRPVEIARRKIANGVLYVLRTCCPWWSQSPGVAVGETVPCPEYDQGGNVWDRKRRLLAVKFSWANQSDLEGVRAMFWPLKEVFPWFKHLWDDTHYGGMLIGWLKAHLGWTIQIACRLKELARSVLVPIADVSDWEKLCNYTALPLT